MSTFAESRNAAFDTYSVLFSLSHIESHFFSLPVSYSIVLIFGCSTNNSRDLDNQISRAPHYSIVALAAVDIWFKFVPQRFMC